MNSETHETLTQHHLSCLQPKVESLFQGKDGIISYKMDIE